jgi:hypothetical protein
MNRLLIVLFPLWNRKDYYYDFYCVCGARRDRFTHTNTTMKLLKWLHPA